MTTQTPSSKAILLLASPAGLLALAALALNDFVLKATVPSWLTGKLSDFALLFLLPFLALALTGWALPTRGRDWAAAAVFGGVAVGFALLKLYPSAGETLYRLTASTGLPLYTRPDPTDLLALLVLPPAWWLWRRSLLPVRLPRRALVALPLAALLALADAAAPEYGITCFSAGADGIAAATTYGREFITRDGGLTWQPGSGMGEFGRCDLPFVEEQIIYRAAGAMRYRYTPGGAIERSTDAGQTWATEYTPVHLNQVRKAYAVKVAPANITYRPGPLAAIEDSVSGNVLFAMGLEGVLVRKAAGEWVWSDVGQYARPPVERVPAAGYPTLLLGEGVLALEMAALGFSTVMLPRHRRRGLRIAKVAIGWLGWVAALVVFPPALAEGAYSGVMVGSALVAVGLYALFSLLDDGIAITRNRPGGAGQAAGFGLLAGLLFLLPLVLWAAEALPDYWLAGGIGGGLAALALVVGLVKQRPMAA